MRAIRGLVAAVALLSAAAAVAAKPATAVAPARGIGAPVAEGAPAAPAPGSGAAPPETPRLGHAGAFEVSGGTAVDLRIAGVGLYLQLRPPPFLLAGHAGVQLRYEGYRVAGSSALDLQSVRPELFFTSGSPATDTEGVSYTFRLGAMLSWSDERVAPPTGSFVAAPEIGSDMSFRLGRSLFSLSESLFVSGLGAGFETGVGYGLDLVRWLRASVQITTSTTIGWDGGASVDLYPYLYVTLFLGR